MRIWRATLVFLVFAEPVFRGSISAAITRIYTSGQSGRYSVGNFSHSLVARGPQFELRRGHFLSEIEGHLSLTILVSGAQRLLERR